MWIIPVLLLVAGITCLVIDLVQDNRSIKRLGFIEHINAKGFGTTGLDKAFRILILLAMASMWIIKR